MRKSFGVLLTIAALFFVASCGASGGEDSSDTTVASDDTPTTEAEETTTTEDEETTTTEQESSGGGDVDVEEWAEGFCGNFEGWLADIQDASGSVADGITPGDVEGAKAAIVGLFDDASATTDTLITSIEEGGAPDIDDGESLVEDLVGKFEDFNAAIGAAKSDAEALPTADPAAFQSGVNTVVETFQTEVTEVGDSFAELDTQYPSPELNAALSSSCSGF